MLNQWKEIMKSAPFNAGVSNSIRMVGDVKNEYTFFIN